jgi:hypothetical protein
MKKKNHTIKNRLNIQYLMAVAPALKGHESVEFSHRKKRKINPVCSPANPLLGKVS